jgi:hypothetical protein
MKILTQITLLIITLYLIVNGYNDWAVTFLILFILSTITVEYE